MPTRNGIRALFVGAISSVDGEYAESRENVHDGSSEAEKSCVSAATRRPTVIGAPASNMASLSCSWKVWQSIGQSRLVVGCCEAQMQVPEEGERSKVAWSRVMNGGHTAGWSRT